jgi:hypothetical protein
VPVAYVPANRANYDHATRRASAIRLVVIHEAEGSYGATISWFRNPHARASANFVVGRSGAVTEMVPWWHIAWHAGNGWVNRHSLGIEHEGYTGTAATVTDTELRASAELVASLLRRYLLPIDRRHVIGHNEVPDPFRPGLFGGWAHHTDPGRYWNWPLYMGYVRSFAAGVVPPPPALDVALPAPQLGQVVRGVVPLEATIAGEPADHVDFLVDGKPRASVRQPPYAYGWDTGYETTGSHVLTAHAVAADGRTADTTVVVKVANPRPKILGLGLADGDPVVGVVHVAPVLSGTVRRVDFLVDGVLRATQLQPPFAYDWDTSTEAPGTHALTVRVAGARVTVTSTVSLVVNG